jgi:dCMP deaminase
MTRPSWDETWLSVADVIAQRSLCVRTKVGAVVVGPNQRVVSTGYNGHPSGFPANNSACTKWCPRPGKIPTESYDSCFSVHAELNALLYAERRDYQDGSLYVTSSCCWDCSKAVANSGISIVVMKIDWKAEAHRRPERSIQFIEQCGLDVVLVEK